MSRSRCSRPARAPAGATARDAARVALAAGDQPRGAAGGVERLGRRPPGPPGRPRAGRHRCRSRRAGGSSRSTPTRASRSLRLNHKRSCQDADGERQAHLAWLLDVPLPPGARAPRTRASWSRTRRCSTPSGFAHDGKKPRDRYSYDELAPVAPALAELAGEYMRTESKAAQPGRERRRRPLERPRPLRRALPLARLRARGARRPDGAGGGGALPRARPRGGARGARAAGRPRRRSRRRTIPHAGMGVDVPGIPRCMDVRGRAGAAVARAHRRRSPRLRCAIGPSRPAGGHGAGAAPAGRARGRRSAPWVSPGRVIFEAALGEQPTPDQARARAPPRRRWRAPRSADPRAFERRSQASTRAPWRWRARAASTARSRSRSPSVGSTPSTARSTSTCWPSSSLAVSWVRPEPLARARRRGRCCSPALALHVTRDRDPQRAARAAADQHALRHDALHRRALGVVGCLVAERIHRRGVALGARAGPRGAAASSWGSGSRR